MIELKYDSTYVEFPAPKFGYEVKITLSTHIQKLQNGKYSIWDDGGGVTTYDRRQLTCEFFLSATETNSMIDIFTNSAKGRNENLAIRIQSANHSDFYPFGPDKGDDGEYGCHLISVIPHPTVGHPPDYFNVACVFTSTNSYPGYAIPSKREEGELQIGTIDGLRWPKQGHRQTIEYGVQTNITTNGTPFGIDRTSTADTWDCELPLTLLQANAARLVDHISGTVRASDVSIIPPSNSYLFGRENDGTATYTCKLIQNEISIIHENHDRFNMSLQFSRKSQA